MPDFRFASSLPREHGRQCPSPLRTSASVVPARFGRGCIESGTNDTRHLFGVLVVQFQMEPRGRERPSARRGVYPGRPDETFVRGSAEKSHLSRQGPNSPASPGSRIRDRQTGPEQQSPAVSRR